MKKTIIEVKNVNKSFNNGNNKIKVLKNINLEIKEGELTCITGYSGSGKTTLLNLISCLLNVDSGKIIVNGDDITKYSEKEKNNYRRKTISIIFQNYNLLSDLTIYENIYLGKELGKTKIDIDEIIKYLNLSKEKNNYPFELSGGQMQRASIARAICKGGNIFLCDEPTGALDVDNGKKVLKYLQDLAKKQNKTVIIVSHNELITLSADHIITLKDGMIIEDKYNKNPVDIEKVTW